MSTTIDDILAMINGGGDSTIELQDIANQTAIARALKNRNVPPVLSSGRATLPNVSGILGNGMDRRQGAADESRLMAERLQIQSAEANRAADAIQPSIRALSGASAIDDIDNGPSTLTPGNSPAAIEEFNLLQGATRGAPAVEGQETLRKYALQRAMEKSRATTGRTPSISDLQFLYKQGLELGLNETDAMNYAVTNMAQYNPKEIAGGMVAPPTRRYTPPGGGAQAPSTPPRSSALPLSNPQPAAPPTPGGGGGVQLSTLEQEAEAKSKLAAAQAEGTVVGQTEAENLYKKPAAEAAMNAAIANYQDTVKKARGVLDVPGLGRVTGLMAYIPSIYGGAAKDKENAISTLRIAMGFDRLQEMRDNSPTGGALGQISDKEGVWLQNAIRNLETSNSKEQFMQNVNDIIERMEGFEQRAKAAFDQQFGAGATRIERPTILPAPTAAAGPKESAAERAKRMGIVVNGK